MRQTHPPALREQARAKVNLFLHVVGRRDDGYHLLDSLAVFPAIGDVLDAMPGVTLGLRLTGPFSAGLAAEPDNLVLRAARALAASTGVTQGAALVLDKRLPIASGIGGGSADAAAALRVLQQLWGVALPPDELAALALRLGADVPVCLAARPARMGGVGETLAAAPRLPSCGMVLVNPGVAVSTPAVFRARAPGFSPLAELPDAWPDAAAMACSLAACTNDLEAPALSLCPEIAEVLATLRALPGCMLARMSGSGATCFALFADSATAETAASGLAQPGWWVWGGGLV